MELFQQTISIKSTAYSIREESRYLYNHENRPSDAGEISRLRVGYSDSHSSGSFLILACFTDSPNFAEKGISIKKITFTFDCYNSTFLNSLSFYKSNKIKDLDYTGRQTGETFKGEILAQKISDTKNLITSTNKIVSFVFSEASNKEIFSAMVSYLKSADNVQNFIICDDDSSPSSSSSKMTEINSIKVEIEYVKGAVYYGKDNEWKQCLVYYGTNEGWKQVVPYYGSGEQWKILG